MRSQIAEALLQRAAGNQAVASAGSAPKPVHPNAVRVMREHGIDRTGRRSKHLAGFTGRRFDYVITLCDELREICREFPGSDTVHRSIPDPAAGATAPGSYPACRAVAADLQTRVHFLAEHLRTAGAAE